MTTQTLPLPAAGSAGRGSLPGPGQPGLLVARQHGGATRAPVTAARGRPDALDVREDLRDLAGRHYRQAAIYEDLAHGRPASCPTHRIAVRHFSNCSAILRMLLEEGAPLS